MFVCAPIRGTACYARRVRIAIIGSCVTRDALNLPDHGFTSVDYFARTSWTSQVTQPWPEPYDVGAEMAGKFGGRAVLDDLGKRVLDGLVAARPDVLVIDLIDERFPVITVDQTKITVSNYFRATPGAADLVARAASRDTLGSRARYRAFDDAARSWAPQIADALPDVPIALHPAWYTPISEDPAEPVQTEWAARVERGNLAGAAYAGMVLDAFESIAGRSISIVAPAASSVRFSHKHRWGTSPFHYAQFYYQELLEQIHRVAHGEHVGSRTDLVIPAELRMNQHIEPSASGAEPQEAHLTGHESGSDSAEPRSGRSGKARALLRRLLG